MLTIHHADELEPLLDGLAELLRVPPTDPFTPDVVVVPAAGMQDAVMAGLGTRLGVLANVELVYPGRFIGRALGTIRSDALDLDPWQIDRLTWHVLAEIHDGSVSGIPGGTTDRWALARRISDLFDRYGTQRPSLLRAWAAGIDSQGTVHEDGSPVLLDAAHRWQPELFRAVRTRIGVPCPAERLPVLLDRLRSGEIQPALPERVSVIGFASLSSGLLSVLQALGAQCDAHVFMQVPSEVAWASSPHQLAGSLQSRASLDVTTHVRNPLLASWGRPALEARALVRGIPGIDERSAAVTSGDRRGAATLLSAVQSGIRGDTVPSPIPGLSPGDGSLQIHACHGETRQLEVLRDALGHLFVRDETLAARDVVVLCPNLEVFAPLIPAVFSRGSLPVPVRVGDRSLTNDDPLVAVLLDVLRVASGRATLSDILGLAQAAPVRVANGWEAAQVERLSAWCAELGARWGLEANHRREWGLPEEIENGTWRQVVDRLLAGVAMPAPTPREVPGGVSPFDHVAAGDTALIGGLANLIARLIELHGTVRTERPIGQWVDLLHEALDNFCAVDRGEEWRIESLHADLDDILACATRTDGDAASSESCPVDISCDDIIALLKDALGERVGRPRYRTGAVTVTSLIPQRGVPARVVCLLGMDDTAVRSGVFEGDDVLGVYPCVGERNPRHESRHLLLDAVLGAQEHLIITCNGADITTNKEMPLIVPVVELLDIVRATLPEKSLDRHDGPVVVRHPRHGFNERALIREDLVRWTEQPYTFDPAMLEAAEARRQIDTDGDQADDRSPWALGAPAAASIDLGELTDAVSNPSRVYLRNRLDVRLPNEVAPPEEGLAIGLDPLATSTLGRLLLDARRSGGSVDDWRRASLLDGAMPPGKLGAAVLDEVAAEVEGIEKHAQAWGVPLMGKERVEVRLAAPLEVMGEVAGVHGNQVLDIRFTRPRASFQLALALRVAALQAAEPLGGRDWMGILICREGSGRTDQWSVGLRVRDTGRARIDNAQRLMRAAAVVHSWVQRDAVPLFERTSRELALGRDSDVTYKFKSDLADAHTSFIWGASTTDSLFVDPLLGSDPPEIREYAHRKQITSRAIAAARWLWDAYGETIEEIAEPGSPS